MMVIPQPVNCGQEKDAGLVVGDGELKAVIANTLAKRDVLKSERVWGEEFADENIPQALGGVD
jgi:hypothetical protein